MAVSQLARLNRILERDSTDTSYKYALLRVGVWQDFGYHTFCVLDYAARGQGSALGQRPRGGAERARARIA